MNKTEYEIALEDSLPFYKGGSYWNPPVTGNYWADGELGEMYAKHLIAHMRTLDREQRCALLGSVLKDIGLPCHQSVLISFGTTLAEVMV